MGPAHCPLCVGLAVLCVVRVGTHGMLLWRLCRPAAEPRLRLTAA